LTPAGSLSLPTHRPPNHPNAHPPNHPPPTHRSYEEFLAATMHLGKLAKEEHLHTAFQVGGWGWEGGRSAAGAASCVGTWELNSRRS